MLLEDGKEFNVVLGDCMPTMAGLPDGCVDFSIQSPPFPSLYAYSNSEADIGNSEDLGGDARLHLSFFYRQLGRVLRPGRVAMIHVAQIPRMKRSGGLGLCDFRGLNIRMAERSGLIFEYDWMVRKNPQSQAIRTRSRELQFAGLENDRANSRGAISDYLIKFRAPGENKVKIDTAGEVQRNDWIEWAEPCWNDIRETDTLNVRVAKGESDTRHICPLQLSVIRRCIKLFTNPGEIVASFFAGIGSEGFEALKLERRFYGVELKPEYHRACVENLQSAIRQREVGEQESLPFATAGEVA